MAAVSTRDIVMSAQRYDFSKKMVGGEKLRIQTGVFEEPLELSLPIYPVREPTSEAVDSSEFSVATSDTASESNESTSTPPSSVEDVSKPEEIDQGTSLDDIACQLDSHKLEELDQGTFLDNIPCQVDFDRRPRSPLSLFSRPSSPLSRSASPLRPRSPIEVVFNALTLNCTSAFEHEVDYLQEKRKREDSGAANLKIGVEDATESHISRLPSSEQENEKNGPKLELARRLLLESDARVVIGVA
ncbi:Sacchrp-dh-NADP domain-containing protein [Mycena indigotica]|uniref:Sacchrp-dh-NADP domain-containing protein n=1 Tax=Mycena indigotica TaxID=2126181 RepID=A0A8H6VV15_9AGAR|nr:Sacchrp-dh-NADP domain-containing protein [Mycena indigotica]KAF7289299.1 Sacchrp-dh-NADP domain-containing protein [Mycena indigotica]